LTEGVEALRILLRFFKPGLMFDGTPLRTRSPLDSWDCLPSLLGSTFRLWTWNSFRCTLAAGACRNLELKERVRLLQPAITKCCRSGLKGKKRYPIPCIHACIPTPKIAQAGSSTRERNERLGRLPTD